MYQIRGSPYKTIDIKNYVDRQVKKKAGILNEIGNVLYIRTKISRIDSKFINVNRGIWPATESLASTQH